MNDTLAQIELFVSQVMKGYEPEDASWNGTQIENDGTIERIYGGVDATSDFFKSAPEPDHALFIVHHGLFWKFSDPRITGVTRNKIEFCFQNKSALMAYHLPLDVHPTYGNNSQILTKLGFTSSPIEPFGYKDEIFYGFLGYQDHSIPISDLLEFSKTHFSKDLQFFDYGKKTIKSCAVISGSGGFGIREAFEKKIDLFVTGEYSHSAYTFARDQHINLLCLTHYGSEKEGVITLGKEIANKFKKDFTFLDILPIF